MDDQKRFNELYEKAIKSMREYSAHDVKKIRDITDGVYVRMIEKDAVLNNDGWIPLIFENGEWKADKRLEDHHFYLVAHKKFATPIKAKYHADGGMRHFQIMSMSNDICIRDYFDEEYPWNDNITHWMELPDMPEVPGVIFGDRDSVAEIYEKASTIMRKYAYPDTDNKKLTWDKTKVAFHLTCPCCGVHVRDSEYIVFEGPGAFNFCPNCGEDLREDKD